MNRLRGRRDARRAVDVDPDVVAVGDKRLTGMKAHADAQRRADGPQVFRKVAWGASAAASASLGSEKKLSP